MNPRVLRSKGKINRFHDAVSLVHANEVIVGARGREESLYPGINIKYIGIYYSGGVWCQ